MGDSIPPVIINVISKTTQLLKRRVSSTSYHPVMITKNTIKVNRFHLVSVNSTTFCSSKQVINPRILFLISFQTDLPPVLVPLAKLESGAYFLYQM